VPGEADFEEELVLEVGGQLVDHGFLLLGLHLEFHLPDQFEEVVDPAAGGFGHLLGLHEVVEGDDVLLVEDALLSMRVDYLDQHLGHVGRQQHEQDHHHYRVHLHTLITTISHGLRANGPGASVDRVPVENACP